MILINSIFYTLFILAMGYYFITNLQWYSYKLNRVLFHHTKTWWHFVYFVIPFALYAFVNGVSDYGFVVVIVYLGLLFQWYKELDKPLVFTGRVKRFFVAMLFVAMFIAFVFKHFAVVLPLFLAYFISLFIEKMLFNGFKAQAQKKLVGNYGKPYRNRYHCKLWKDQYQKLYRTSATG